MWLVSVLKPTRRWGFRGRPIWQAKCKIIWPSKRIVVSHDRDPIIKGSVPCMSTFCVSVFIEPAVDGFPRSHRQPLANPLERQGRLPPQPPRQRDLHRAALAPQRQIGWLPARLFQSQRHQPRRLGLCAFSAILSVGVNLPISLGAGLAQG